MLTVQVSKKAYRILRVVFINGWVGVGTDYKKEKGRISDGQESKCKYGSVNNLLVFAHGITQSEYDTGSKCEEIEYCTYIEGEADDIHEEELEPPCQLHYPWDDPV